MVVETEIRPRPPYSLARSSHLKSDATRVFRDGVLTMVFEAGGAPSVARVAQRSDGMLAVRVESGEADAAFDHLRFVLAAEDDHTEFLRRFAGDPLLATPIRNLRGLRPVRTPTVTHALLKAVCGQLIQAKAARALENKLVRVACAGHAGLRLPPTRETFAGECPAALERQGLVSRKAKALVRLSRELDLERLRGHPTEAARARIERERGLGPWSAGMVCLYGLGRFEHGLVGDLGLVKLCAALRGRWADADDTRELLEPYGEWAGLASVYLLAGLKAVRPEGAPGRRPPRREAARFEL